MKYEYKGDGIIAYDYDTKTDWGSVAKKHSPSFLSQVLLLSYYYLVGNLPPTFNKQLISYKERFVIEQGEKCIDY